jgi:hypothetical protein
MKYLILGGRWHTNDRHPLCIADTPVEAGYWLTTNGFNPARAEHDRRVKIKGLWTQSDDEDHAYWARVYQIGEVNNPDIDFDHCGVKEITGAPMGDLRPWIEKFWYEEGEFV